MTLQDKDNKKKRRHRKNSKLEFLAFRCSAEEAAQIKYNALLSGLSISEFLRVVSLSGLVPVPKKSPVWNPRLNGRLGRIANNVGQILSYSNNSEIPIDVFEWASQVANEIPLTSDYIAQQKNPPPDRGDGFFKSLENPGYELNKIVKALHISGESDDVLKAIPHLMQIKEIMQEVRRVC